ncbi:hypothetical protein G7075_08965 [Phycicoccus sp. HDW14]|nr:hypothetical protein [Phycicoccus sp. HDW14]QIM21230.1 hypothetical protein G7075_08965 [Phycicoccus sp. HDW14]
MGEQDLGDGSTAGEHREAATGDEEPLGAAAPDPAWPEHDERPAGGAAWA